MPIVDDVIKRQVIDYERAVEAEINQLRKSEEVVSVYSTGMVGAPGISDLDLIVVLDIERTQGSLGRDLKRSLVEAPDPYIRMHPMFIISPPHFQKVRWLADLSTLNCVYGEEIDSDLIPDQYSDILRAVCILEVGIHKLFALRQILLQKSQSARDLLLTLNSIGYSLLLAKQLETTAQAHRGLMEKFRHDVTQIRASWFGNTPPKSAAALYALIEQCPALLCCAFDAASAYLIQVLQLSCRDQPGNSGSIAIDPSGKVLLSSGQRTCDTTFFEPSFCEWVYATRQETIAALHVSVGLAIPFAYYVARLHSESKNKKDANERVNLDSSLLAWCLSSNSLLRHGLEQRADIMYRYAHWYRPYWGYGFPFSPYTSLMISQMKWWELIWRKIDRKLI